MRQETNIFIFAPGNYYLCTTLFVRQEGKRSGAVFPKPAPAQLEVPETL